MEALKKQRKAYRTAFSKALTAFTEVMASSQNREEKIVAFQFLETKMTELDSVHSEYNKELFASQMSDEEISKELETDDQYKTKYLSAKLAMTELPMPIQNVQQQVPTMPNPAKTRKWPHLELPKFNGNIRDWLPFWSQFKKIHEDTSLSKEDKFQYLVQVTVPDSRANELVKSYPATGANYDKVIASLKNRFGQDDLIVEFYVRELLGLALQNAVKGSKKVSFSSIYDKI